MVKKFPTALTIAGSDSGGGAGIQADLLTFAANGVFGTCSITCLTAQNPDGVTAVHAAPPGMVVEQARQVARYFKPAAAKTGMLYSAEIVSAVAAFLRENSSISTVIDPVMVATSGSVLLDPMAVSAVRSELIPIARLVTPNLDEAGVLLGRAPGDASEMPDAASELTRIFGVPFLLKGGHLGGSKLVDVLALPGGDVLLYHDDRIENVNTHGSGCALSAAIAAGLARGLELDAAVRMGRAFIRDAMLRPARLNNQNFLWAGGRAAESRNADV